MPIEKPYCVYRIEHDESGLYYYGATTLYKENDLQSYWGRGSAWMKFMNQFPKEEWPNIFTREILHTFETPEEAGAKEYEYVNEETLLDPKMMNMISGGGGVTSEEARKKNSEAQKGKKLTPEHCLKMSEAQKGKKLTPEHIANAAKARMKLTSEQVKEIVELQEKGMIQAKIGKIFGVSQKTIYRYLRQNKIKKAASE